MNNIRPDILTVLEETKRFFHTQKTGAALIHVKSIRALQKPQLDLTHYNFPHEYKRYIDDKAAVETVYWQQRLCVNDHMVPALGPWYGIAEHSAFLGGKVVYAPDTSWQEETVPNLADLSRVKMDESNEAFQMIVGGIAYARAQYGNVFAPQVRGVSGVLEIANTLRGSEFFYDFYEDPDSLKTLLALCKDAIIWYYNKQLDAAGDYYGGVVTGFGQWMEGRPIGHMSEDTTTMISLAQYEEFGRPYTQEICNHFDGAFIHTHALSERCVPSISQIHGIRLMELSSDPNTDRAIEVFKRQKDSFEAIPVLCLKKEEILQNMDLLRTQKTVIWYEADTLADAQEICTLVREKLPVQ